MSDSVHSNSAADQYHRQTLPKKEETKGKSLIIVKKKRTQEKKEVDLEGRFHFLLTCYQDTLRICAERPTGNYLDKHLIKEAWDPLINFAHHHPAFQPRLPSPIIIHEPTLRDDINDLGETLEGCCSIS